MKTYKLIGLTGQSGAGKSTVARVFAEYGATVINADKIVASLYKAQSPCVSTIAAVFGSDCLLPNGEINRKKLAERAFSSKENTALLGKLVHPFVTARLFELLKGKTGVVIYDAPQLFESGADVICDSVVAVVAERSVRRQRIIERDGITAAQADSRLNAQYDEEFFRMYADIIIENNTDKAALEKTARSVYTKIKSEVS